MKIYDFIKMEIPDTSTESLKSPRLFVSENSIAAPENTYFSYSSRKALSSMDATALKLQPETNPNDDQLTRDLQDVIQDLTEESKGITLVHPTENTTYVAPSMVNSVPELPPETNLNDDQITEVMSYLLYLQDEYFEEIRLSKDLCKNFVWNIPTPVYKAFKNAQDYMYPDIMNPLFLMYIYCADNMELNYPEFMMFVQNQLEIHNGFVCKKLMESIDDEDDTEEDE